MTKNKNTTTPNRIIALLCIVIICFVLVIAGYSVWYQHTNLVKTYNLIHAKIGELESLQKENELETVDVKGLYKEVNSAKQQISKYDYTSAYVTLEKLKSQTTSDQALLDEAIYKRQAEEKAQEALANKRNTAIAENGGGQPSNSFILPILMYHKPPANFAQQMDVLKAKGYTTIHMSDVANFISGKTKLPDKAAVITFDDGFSAQKDAMSVLQKNQQKATLYLIEGGVMSHYCIGILRSNTTCGDSYLSTQDVKGMLSSNLIEIGAHTVDHPNMVRLSEADQQFQILTSKAFLEKTFGVPITTFAYPYGYYNGTTVKLLKQDGFLTAVTTQPGISQTLSEPLLLRRIRSTLDLP